MKSSSKTVAPHHPTCTSLQPLFSEFLQQFAVKSSGDWFCRSQYVHKLVWSNCQMSVLSPKCCLSYKRLILTLIRKENQDFKSILFFKQFRMPPSQDDLGCKANMTIQKKSHFFVTEFVSLLLYFHVRHTSKIILRGAY